MLVHPVLAFALSSPPSPYLVGVTTVRLGCRGCFSPQGCFILLDFLLSLFLPSFVALEAVVWCDVDVMFFLLIIDL